ncbi:MAG: ComF family protein [Acidimicrobiia bacterium]
MLLPRTCPVCGRAGQSPCPGCRRQLRAAPSLPPPPLVDRCVALLDYAGPGREVVARLKYRNARSSLAYLAGGMAALVDPAEVDVVTWAPTTAARRRQRGFDQSELLARAVARRLRRPCRRLLRRLPGPAQTGRDLAERRRGPAFEARASPAGRRVLLVDDVVTTGATVTAAARTLRAGGATTVQALAAARTSRRGIHSAMARVRVCG